MIKKLAKELTRVNKGVTFEVSDYNSYTFESWINVRGALVPLTTSLTLPYGCSWFDETHITYKGKNVHLVPLP